MHRTIGSLLGAACLFAAASTSGAAIVYVGAPGVTVTGGTVVETGQEDAYNTAGITPFVTANSLTKLTGTVSASSAITGFEATQATDGIYPTTDNGTATPWLPSEPTGIWTLTLNAATDHVRYIAFGTQYDNRSAGTYQVEYTVDGNTWQASSKLISTDVGDVIGRNLIDMGDLNGVLAIRIFGSNDANEASVSLSEVEVYSAVPEPTVIATLGSLCVAGLSRRRRK